MKKCFILIMSLFIATIVNAQLSGTYTINNITFNTYPASQTVNLNNTFNDPDDPDEDIVYSLISNSNEAELNAYLANPNGRFLVLERLNNKNTTSTLVLRATSDGQYVDFEVQVQMIYVSPQAVDENNFITHRAMEQH